MVNFPQFEFYSQVLWKIWYGYFDPALTGSMIPLQCLAKAGSVSGGSTARKSPIGSTNNQWGMKKPPLIEVSLYMLKMEQ